MPIIVVTRDGTCRACGGRVRKGEYADFTAAEGVSHPEPQCATAPARFRPNQRAGRCGCGTWVPVRDGLLVLVRDDTPAGGRKEWGVRCSRCAAR